MSDFLIPKLIEAAPKAFPCASLPALMDPMEVGQAARSDSSGSVAPPNAARSGANLGWAMADLRRPEGGYLSIVMNCD